MVGRTRPQVEAARPSEGVLTVHDQDVVANDLVTVGGQPGEGGALAVAAFPENAPRLSFDDEPAGVERTAT
jgi:hypothetical protein